MHSFFSFLFFFGSGTLSYIFNNFMGTKAFSQVVKEAKEAGYTEPDPRDDLSGTDVARKVLADRFWMFTFTVMKCQPYARSHSFSFCPMLDEISNHNLVLQKRYLSIYFYTDPTSCCSFPFRLRIKDQVLFLSLPMA